MSTKDRDGLHRRPNKQGGIWYFHYRGADGRWHEKSTSTANYGEARQKRITELEKIARGELPAELAKWTLEKAAAAWQQERHSLILPVTAKGDEWTLKPLLKALGGKKLGSIRASDVRAYQSARAAQVSARCVNREVQVLRSIMLRAHLWSRIEGEFKSLPMKSRGPGRALSPAEEQRLFFLAETKPVWQTVPKIAVVSANTGLRPAEFRRLRLADVLVEKKMLSVRRSATKTDAGARLVPLNGDALGAMSWLLSRAKKLGAQAPEHYLLPANLSKHTKDGDPAQVASGFDPSRPQASWRSAWRSLSKAAGLAGLRPYDLRHHFVTKLAERGVPIQATMSLVSHMSPEMTRYYTHISDASVRQAVEALCTPKAAAPESTIKFVERRFGRRGKLRNHTLSCVEVNHDFQMGKNAEARRKGNKRL